MTENKSNLVRDITPTGTLPRPNQGIDSFSVVEIPPNVIILDLTGNLLTDFTDFLPGKNLQT
jgi:hypothetical protein